VSVPKTRRRRLQFSLRTLLVLVLLASLPLGWLSARLRYKQREEKIAKELYESGTLVFYDYFFTEKWEPGGPKWLRDVLGEKFFAKAVGAICYDAGRDQLALLDDLSDLQYLDLSYTGVDDGDLHLVAPLTGLRILSLYGTKVTPAGVGKLRGALPDCRIVTPWERRTPQFVGPPAVSPCGTKVAFALSARVPEQHGTISIRFSPSDFFKDNGHRLWVVDLSSGEAYDTRGHILIGKCPTWAQDGSNLVFVSGRMGPDTLEDSPHMGLDRVDLESEAVVTIAKPDCSNPRYSPDGKHFGYVHDGDLVVDDLSSSEREVIQKGLWWNTWLWSPDGSSVFYLRAGTLCEMRLADKKERVLLSGRKAAALSDQLACSPDGGQLGFECDDGWFRTIDLASGKITRRFQHKHHSFAWNESGICYVRTIDGKARLMLYDPSDGESVEIAVGPFSYPCWVDRSRILVRKGNAELWVYDIHEKKGVRVFPTDRQP
jgi:hypothetical protein